MFHRKSWKAPICGETIDQSEMMITEAVKRNAAESITYRVCSLQDYEYPTAACDLAISNLVLHYVDNFDVIYRRIHKTLCPGGVFLMNIEHPTFTAGVAVTVRLDAVCADSDKFISEAPQFDDITMLCLEYKAQMVAGNAN